MVAIYDKHKASLKIQEAIEKAATLRRQKITVFEDELAFSVGMGARTLRAWKTPSGITNTVDDALFLGVVFLLMSFDGGELQWLYDLLKSTSIPVFYPITEELLKAYLSQVRLANVPLTSDQIHGFLTKVMAQSRSNDGLQGVKKGVLTTTLQELIPLEPEHRDFIRESREVCVLGLTLYRYVESYIHDLADALKDGANLRVILPEAQPYIINMISFRSVSGASSEEQRDRIERTIRTLQRIQRISGASSITLKTINYLTPYGITVYHNRKRPAESVCQVRLTTFKTPTPAAPAILTRADTNDGWFSFFVEQFELMWDHAAEYALQG